MESVVRVLVASGLAAGASAPSAWVEAATVVRSARSGLVAA